MALTTTPGPACESLCSVLDADAYHESRGAGVAWAGMDQLQKEPLLRQAYDYLLTTYGARWPTDFEFGAADVDGNVPQLVRNASAVLALRAKDGPLDPEIKAQEIERTTGPITKKFAAAPNGGRRKFPDIERMLAPYLVRTSSLVIPMRRA